MTSRSFGLCIVILNFNGGVQLDPGSWTNEQHDVKLRWRSFMALNRDLWFCSKNHKLHPLLQSKCYPHKVEHGHGPRRRPSHWDTGFFTARRPVIWSRWLCKKILTRVRRGSHQTIPDVSGWFKSVPVLVGECGWYIPVEKLQRWFWEATWPHDIILESLTWIQLHPGISRCIMSWDTLLRYCRWTHSRWESGQWKIAILNNYSSVDEAAFGGHSQRQIRSN